MSERITIPFLEEYTKRNNIEYDFLITTEYNEMKAERILLSMVDRNNNTLQFEEVYNSDKDDLYEGDIIQTAKRLIRQQKLKELGI